MRHAMPRAATPVSAVLGKSAITPLQRCLFQGHSLTYVVGAMSATNRDLETGRPG